jgi:hypothetical protein
MASWRGCRSEWSPLSLTKPLNYQPDLVTLARDALMRELLSDGLSERAAIAVVGRLVIRIRGEDNAQTLESGA